MTVPFANNSEFLEAIALLVDLQSAICDDDEDRADTLRDALDIPLRKLSWEENEWLRGLSGDLDMLCDQEVFEPNFLSPAAYQHDLVTASRNFESDPEAVLVLLRKKQEVLPTDAVAYFRGRAYSLLGLHDVGALFFRRAVELNPNYLRYKLILLNSYWFTGKLDRARPLAEVILTAHEGEPDIIFAATGVMLQVIRNHAPLDRIALGKLRRKVEQTIRSIPTSEVARDLTAFGFILMGAISEALNRTAQAGEDYSEACRLTPGDETPFLLRGRLMLRIDERKAFPDFRQAINLGTADPLPYLFIARESLKNGNYADCRALCFSLINLGGSMVQGQAYEFLAIAEAQTQGENNLAQHYFSEARRLFPTDSNIQQNFAIFEQAKQQHLGYTSGTVNSTDKYQFDLREANQSLQNDPLDIVLKVKSNQLWASSNPFNTFLGIAA